MINFLFTKSYLFIFIIHDDICTCYLPLYTSHLSRISKKNSLEFYICTENPFIVAYINHKCAFVFISTNKTSLQFQRMDKCLAIDYGYKKRFAVQLKVFRANFNFIDTVLFVLYTVAVGDRTAFTSNFPSVLKCIVFYI